MPSIVDKFDMEKINKAKAAAKAAADSESIKTDIIEQENKKKGEKNYLKTEYRAWDLNGNRASATPFFEVDPHNIVNWVLHDRPENELGDIDGLAEEFREHGQQQPCIVRRYEDDHSKYELIVGERRWRAALLANVNLKVIQRNLSDEECAIIQFLENNSRQDLSDYAQAMSIKRYIDNNILTKARIKGLFNISDLQFSRLSAFHNLPEELKEAIGDFRLVSARTATELRSISAKGDEYINILKTLAQEIAKGEIGANNINRIVKRTLTEEDKTKAIFKKKFLYPEKGITLQTKITAETIRNPMHLVPLYDRINYIVREFFEKLGEQDD